MRYRPAAVRFAAPLLVSLVPLLTAATCGSAPVAPADPAKPPVYSVHIYSTHDASGVATATCPAGSRIVGGGCRCVTSGNLFGGEPAGNGYVCGCYSASGGANADALCLSSDPSGTIAQGLTAPDPEAVELADEYRARVRDAASAAGH